MPGFKYNIDTLDIDDNKKEAITTTEGPLLIIAGPGSGKTKTLVERVVYLISKDVKPEQIMVATFTEKAAKVHFPLILTTTFRSKLTTRFPL
jgi:superfamily I DNA/RNA helicase